MINDEQVTAADIADAESLWRSLSDALDSVSAEETTAYLVRVVLLTATDHLTVAQLRDVLEQAR